MGRRVKPHLWKLVPDDQHVGRHRNVTELICRSTCAAASIAAGHNLDDLAEGIDTAVRPFLASAGIEVEIWTDDDTPPGAVRATVYAGMRPAAHLTCTEVPERDVTLAEPYTGPAFGVGDLDRGVPDAD